MNKTDTTVIYHADCLDGFGAALAAWRHFGDTARYFALHHGDPWNDDWIAGRSVYILDFSFPPDILENMAKQARQVIQIDHHRSALKDCAEKLPIGLLGRQDYRHPELPLRLIFDLEQSGAHLAWTFFHPSAPLPLMLQHVEAQDLWRFQPDTQAFCRSLRLQAFDFVEWNALLEACSSMEASAYRRMIDQGTAIDRFFQNEVAQLANGGGVRPASLKGDPVDALQARRHGQAIISEGNEAWRCSTGLAINANALFASELGNLLAERSDSWGLVWHMDASGTIRASLRAKGKVDVAEIAARYGGGGHPNAAGFRMTAERFMREVLERPNAS